MLRCSAGLLEADDANLGYSNTKLSVSRCPSKKAASKGVRGVAFGGVMVSGVRRGKHPVIV